ncbi:MAG TPA: hypothetical protein VGK25_07205 [Ignavibacteria bacterium]|jgi:DNA polymerase/3'-5' exonuclease PolX
MELETAKQIADEIINLIGEYCLRIEVAGSTRRGKNSVHDLELVAIPKNLNVLKNKLGFHLLKTQPANTKNPFMKSGQRYIQFKYNSQQVDLFLANEDNWGLIYLMRTGSAEFSAAMLAKWKKVTAGGYSENGYLHTADGKKVITREEKDFFRLCKMDFVAPEFRS